MADYCKHLTSRSPAEVARRIAYELLTEEPKRVFGAGHELNFTHLYAVKTLFRVSLYQTLGTVATSFRILTVPIRTLDELGCLPLVEKLTHYPSGLILIRGSVGSGRTTMMAMVDIINSTQSKHIFVVETETSCYHSHKLSVVWQLEIRPDTPSLVDALKGLLRKDADVVVIEGLANLEAMELALSIAENDCLVIARIATVTAESTIERFIESFPADQRKAIRQRISTRLLGVVCNQLVPKADGTGQVLAQEALLRTYEVGELISQSRTEEIPTLIERWTRLGMRTIDGCLRDLFKAGTITEDMALTRSMNRVEMARLLAANSSVSGGNILPPAV